MAWQWQWQWQSVQALRHFIIIISSPHLQTPKDGSDLVIEKRPRVRRRHLNNSGPVSDSAALD